MAIDTTDPVVTAETTPVPGAGGWRNSAVTVRFTCHDATSGVASCPSDVTLTGDGANQSVTGTATDRVGHSTTITVGDIDIDSTGPVVSATVLPVAGANGWLRAATVHFDCSDALSGVASCPQDVTVPEGADQVVTGTASDVAGNSSSVTVSNLDVDPTAPVISFVATPTPNGAGWNRSDVTVDVVCTDADIGGGELHGRHHRDDRRRQPPGDGRRRRQRREPLVGNGHRQARPHPADHRAHPAGAGIINIGELLRGTSTDALSGIERVTVTYSGSSTIVRTVPCGGVTTCSWTDDPPSGFWTITAVATDVAGNTEAVSTSNRLFNIVVL